MSLLPATTNDDVRRIIEHTMSENTRIAYTKGWNRFTRFCDARGLKALPAEIDTLIKFFTHIGTHPSTQSGKLLGIGSIVINLSAIGKVHELFDYEPLTKSYKVRMIINGLRRMKSQPPRRVKALRENEIKAMLDACPDSVIGIRDAAILALGFSAALRRSEIVNLNVSDITFLRDAGDNLKGCYVLIRKSKTDQTGQGQKIAVIDGKHLQPVTRIERWLKVSGLKSGHLFRTLNKNGTVRSGRGKVLGIMHHCDVPRLVKYYGRIIGLDPSQIAGHSLRAGFVTCAVANHARIDKIMAITRHKNPTTVMDYIRDEDAFSDHAGENFL